MTQIERIEQMEQALNQTIEATTLLADALDRYEQAQDAIHQLSAYYGSDDWKKDYADDALADCRELNIRMLEIVTEMLRQQ